MSDESSVPGDSSGGGTPPRPPQTPVEEAISTTPRRPREDVLLRWQLPSDDELGSRATRRLADLFERDPSGGGTPPRRPTPVQETGIRWRLPSDEFPRDPSTAGPSREPPRRAASAEPTPPPRRPGDSPGGGGDYDIMGVHTIRVSNVVGHLAMETPPDGRVQWIHTVALVRYDDENVYLVFVVVQQQDVVFVAFPA